MKLEKANNRDKEIHKKKNGMRVSGKSVFLIIEIYRQDYKKNHKGEK